MDRDYFIDTLRAGSVLVVVFGHWLATSVVWGEGVLVGDNALEFIPELHHLTWLFQVMPLLFFVGGFSNSRSYRHHSRAYLPYLRTRLKRLLTPTLVFVVTWLAVGAASELLDLSRPNLLDRGADIAALPFWFVGIYVAVVALAPAMIGLHERFGWVIPIILGTSAIVIDLLVYQTGFEAIGFLNYVFVWLLPHQLGFFYADGRRMDHLWPALGTAVAALIVLTTTAGYPVSMIYVPGAERGNTEPPSVAIVALAIGLIAVALIAKPWLSRGRSWVTRVNRVPLSLYLWHVSAIPVAVAILYPLGFPQDEIGSTGWWVWRPVWLAILALVLVALVTVAGRFEIHPAPRPMVVTTGPGRVALAATGVILMGIALLGFGVTGFNRPLANTGEGVLAFTMNPAFNSVHLVLGLLGLLAAFYMKLPRIGATLVGSVLLILGAVGWSEGIEVLGSNRPVALLDIGVGVFCLTGLFLRQQSGELSTSQHTDVAAGTFRAARRDE